MTDFMLHVIKLNALAAAIILLVLAVSRLLDKWYSARWKYLIWLFVSVFLLIPVRVPADLGVVRIEIPQNKERVEDMTGTNNKVPAAENRGETSKKTNPPAKTEENGGQMSGKAEGMTNKLGVDRLAGLFLLTWLSGICIFAAYRILICRAAYRRLRRWSVPVKNQKVNALYKETVKAMGIKNAPKLRVHDEVEGPMLAGMRHPNIYIPKKLYTLEECRLIFCHELRHYSHRDLWYKLLLMIVSTVYWFNPVLCLMRREAERDIEFLCDEAVMEGKSKNEKLNYNQLLLKTAAESSYKLSASLNDGGLSFKKRMLNIMKAGKLKKGRMLLICFVLVLVSSNILIGCSIKNSNVQNKSQTEGQENKSEKDSGENETKNTNSSQPEKALVPSEITPEPALKPTDTPKPTDPPAVTPEATPESTPEPTPEATPEPTPETSKPIELTNKIKREEMPALVKTLGLQESESTEFGDEGTAYKKNGIRIMWYNSSYKYDLPYEKPISISCRGNTSLRMEGIYCGQDYTEGRDKLLQDGWLPNKKEKDRPTAFLKENEDGRWYIQFEMSEDGDAIEEWSWCNWPEGDFLYFVDED